MKALQLCAVVSALIISGGCAAPPPPAATSLPPGDPGTLRDVEAFNTIGDKRARSIALFEEAGKVLLHPRCVNCHPAGERPTQTDRMQPHVPLVVRGKDGHGAPGLRCDTCHHAANYDAARVPGHPQWHLAPIEMAWQGRTLGQICEQIKDPARNGDKNMDALLHHMAEDSLVGWGWAPGADRTPAPGSQALFGALLRAWAETGAHCPASGASREAAGP